MVSDSFEKLTFNMRLHPSHNFNFDSFLVSNLPETSPEVLKCSKKLCTLPTNLLSVLNKVDVVQYHEGLLLQDSLRSQVKVSERVTRKLSRAFSQVLKTEATE